MRLLLVRHGESVWNAGRVLQGQADIPLSDVGRAQADALAPVITGLQPDSVLTSDLSRARETASRLGYPDASVAPGLREIDVGTWQGRAIADLMSEDPEGYAGWRAGTYQPPGGESWSAFSARTGAAIRSALRERSGRTVLAVCHGGVIRALLHRCLGLAPRQILPVAPASLTALRLNGTLDTARLEIFNYRPGSLDLEAPD